MAELYYHNDGEQDGGRVQKTHPLPVEVVDSTEHYDTAIPSTATITTTSSQAVAANPSNGRKYLLLVNDSDTVIYLRLGGAVAVANQGIRLNANGGSYEMSRKLGNLFPGAVQAIHGGTGNKVLLVTEGV